MALVAHRKNPTFGILLLAIAGELAPARGRAQAQDFPGVSKYSYYSQIAGHLRHPMFHDGTLLADDIDWQDDGAFSDSLFADLFPYGRSRDDPLLFATLGLTESFGPLYFYFVGGGVIDYGGSDRSFGKLILGAGVRRSLLSWLSLDLYLQAEGDTAEGFDWEIGGYPIQTPLLACSVHAFFQAHTPRVIETRDRLAFVGFEFLSNLDLDTRRYALSVSRRSLAAFFGETESSTFEAEVQAALIHQARTKEDLLETRLMFFASTVGDGQRGEARPGVHLNLSYTSRNSSAFKGFGVELGFGAKQNDTARAQELYFTIFYNYAGYFYRHPSLRWGIGLTGRY
jgi:hypothetical protein